MSRLARLQLVSIAAVMVLSQAIGTAENWPAWRGPRGDGTSQEHSLPLTWNGETGETIAWKVELPGSGHSSPIVWQDKLFVVACVTTTGTTQGDRVLLCLDATSGKQQWQRTVLQAPLEKKHTLNSHASGTPATDGERVIVTFLEPDFADLRERTPGDMVVVAYDMDGKEQWRVQPGRFASVHGYCSSPVLFEDLVIVNGDHDGDGYLVALDKQTGMEVWRTPRPNNTRSYVTPIVREIDGRMQLLLSGSKCVASYDPRTGRQHWTMDGPTEQFVASLVYDGALVYLTAGFPERHILAIRPDGRGRVGDEKIVWRTAKNCSYVPSPVLCGEYLVVAADNGVVSCFLAASGKLQWTKRLGKQYSASLAATSDLVHLLADDGVTTVIRPGPKLDVVAENPLGEACYASPALSQGRIFLRGEKHLFCIGSSAP